MNDNRQVEDGWCNNPEVNYKFDCNCDRCRWLRANE